MYFKHFFFLIHNTLFKKVRMIQNKNNYACYKRINLKNCERVNILDSDYVARRLCTFFK